MWVQTGPIGSTRTGPVCNPRSQIFPPESGDCREEPEPEPKENSCWERLNEAVPVPLGRFCWTSQGINTHAHLQEVLAPLQPGPRVRRTWSAAGSDTLNATRFGGSDLDRLQSHSAGNQNRSRSKQQPSFPVLVLLFQRPGSDHLSEPEPVQIKSGPARISGTVWRT